MLCQGAGDDALQADKLDVLYGEADSAARARLNAHVASCDACREELRALAGLRRHLASWRLPQASPTWSARGLVVPRWLAAAALFLLGFGATLGASGYISLRRELAAQEARATRLEQQQREAKLRLAAAGASPQAPVGDANALLAHVDERLDERIRASEAQQLERLDRRFADWQERAEVRRRVDMAQVAASLSYLDGRHGEQLARTNELMGYMLQASEKR